MGLDRVELGDNGDCRVQVFVPDAERTGRWVCECGGVTMGGMMEELGCRVG